jgi:hypothetical protein
MVLVKWLDLSYWKQLGFIKALLKFKDAMFVLIERNKVEMEIFNPVFIKDV